MHSAFIYAHSSDTTRAIMFILNKKYSAGFFAVSFSFTLFFLFMFRSSLWFRAPLLYHYGIIIARQNDCAT